MKFCLSSLALVLDLGLVLGLVLVLGLGLGLGLDLVLGLGFGFNFCFTLCSKFSCDKFLQRAFLHLHLCWQWFVPASVYIGPVCIGSGL